VAFAKPEEQLEEQEAEHGTDQAHRQRR